MKIRRSTAFGCVMACVFSTGAAALAASLDAVQGEVLVNRGAGYQVVRGPTSLKPGDSVIVNPGSSAQITYADGCSVPVEMGSVKTVGEQSPCVTQGTGPQGPGGLNATTLAIGAVAVGGIAGAAVLLSQGGGDGEDKPASDE
jgi:hypothetical protein